MQQHPILTVTKLGLLALIAALLVMVFVAQNETQSKVIATRQSVDELKGQVADVSRRMTRGVQPAAGGVEAEASGESRPIKPGFTSILTPEPDRPRPPDDEIDFDAQLRTATLSEPKGMNILTSDRDHTTSTLFGHYVLPPLGERKDSNRSEFKPGLAERVEVSPDRREYYVRIRPGVMWHRPPVDLTDPKYAWMRGDHEVTAEDIVFSLDMIRNERADTETLRPLFKDIEEYKAIDPYTLYVRWKEATYYSTGTLLGGDLVPYPKWIYTREEDGSAIDEAGLGQRFASHWFNKLMCGYGPYAFKEYKKGDYVLLERNEAYWGRRPAYKTVYYKLGLKDDEPRYNNFMSFDENGERAQYAYPISSTRLKRDVYDNDGSSELLKQLAAKKLNIYGFQRLMYAYQGWACRSNLFSDPRVRRAMTMAANREAWQRDILVNEATFPTGVVFPDTPEYDKTIKPWPYDLAVAAKLLEEAGWTDGDGNGVREKTIDGQKVEFRFKVVQGSASPELEAMRNDWEQSLRKIGVIMEPDVMEWNQFLKKTEDREFQAYSAAWYLADEWSPESLHHSNQIPIAGADNRVEWSNPRIDAIIDELKTTFDLKKRYELSHEFHRIFHEEQPYTILWSWRNSVAIDSRIGGIENARSWLPQISWLNIWKVKRGIAKYDDGRYERPKRPGT